MPQNEELVKQLKFIVDLYPRVFMNTPLYVAMTEIKKIIASKEQIAHTSAKICPVCNTNPYSLNYHMRKHTYVAIAILTC
jgi:formate dehydrogenase maturation protein FdhE